MAAPRSNRPKNRIEGDLVAPEIIEARVKAAEAARGAANARKKHKTTPITRQVAGLDNDAHHTRNESARQVDARETVDRDSELPTQWRQPRRLDAPPPRPGYVNYWASFKADSAEDAEQFDQMLEEGWRPIRRARTRKVHELTANSHGKYGQYYVKRGMILMEIPQRIWVQRERYYRDQTKSQNKGVDRTMFKLQNRYMPVLKPERSTRVSTQARRGRLEPAGDEAFDAAEA